MTYCRSTNFHTRFNLMNIVANLLFDIPKCEIGQREIYNGLAPFAKPQNFLAVTLS